ncbi:cell wall protein DAN4 [Pyrus ussuriensis x Pyrus communis]|uniref:Cell wall protein DAN4 n=1 Tax=Pyrus ussuriensis x Pyrus communis TaxID=2448454 RepID=A0A5N5HEM9_9ROSA|nr:cell wall protein DAN4 [Pyrus ussuriensis x Pyrus communis]
MGESIVDFAKDAEKVVEGEIVASNSSNPQLEVSVSFGRFENDSSLSWEKWSTFSQNKYLEEVGKCATPGSVAQKRAYFEAHYKRVAARKAEEMMEQEKQMQGGDTFRSESDQKSGDQMDSEAHFEIDLANSQSNAQGNDQEANFDSEISEAHVDDLKEDDVFATVCQNSLAVGEKEETDDRTDNPELDNPEEELVLVKEVENVPAESQGVQEIPKTLDNDVGSAPEVKEVKEEKPRLDLRKVPLKVTPMSKERNVASVKKKAVPPIAKTPEKSAPRVSKSISTPTPKASKSTTTPTPRASKLLSTSTPKASKSTTTPTPRASKPLSTSTPRVSKSISTSTPRVAKSISTSTPRVAKFLSTSTATPASRSSVKKSTVSSFPRSKNPSTEETKEVPPKRLHLSLNLESSPTMSGSAFVTTTTRKSSIMENMGDKDIVKRAFKTFQNNYNQPQPSNEEKPPTPKQLSTKGKESRVSTSVPLTKENGGYLDKRTAKAAPSSVSLRSDDCVDKREISQKLAAKSNAKVTEKAHSQPKSKDQKEAEIKKLRRSLNFKATPTPCVHRGQKVSEK